MDLAKLVSHKGQDVEGGGEVAVYELHRRFLDDPSSGSSIWQQVRTVAAIRHEGLVRVLDTVERSHDINLQRY